jgi:branched-chain amino acid transport system permease protein
VTDLSAIGGVKRRRPLDWLLSGDRPGGVVLNLVMLAVLLALAFAPFLFPGTRSVAVAARICIFIVLAASYDVMLGYTGIASFAHSMFFGIGAYGVAIALAKLEVGWGAALLGTAIGVAVSIAVAAVIGLLSLRVRAIFFSMITLAVASFAYILATQLRDFTGGEDGLTFSVPELLTPGFRLLADPVLGVRLDGRIVTYYLVFAASLGLFLLMLRIVNSPFGRVLQAIRENPFRAEALGYRIVFHRTLATCISAAVATLAGALAAIWQHYVGPDTALSLSIQLDVLVMVVIGGMGSLYGAIAGAALFVIARNYLQGLLGALSAAAGQAGLTLAAGLLHPDRWLMWLGLMFILAVYFVPAGIVGALRKGGEGSR